MALESLFAQWEAAGIFAYALPFLLIFALVFGILTKINIFTKGNEPNKAVNAIISLTVALMALQFNIVSEFFSSIFPRFGVALAIILVILIFIGLFTDLGNKNMKWILSGVILIALIAVLWVPLSELGFKINLDFLKGNFAVIIFLILIIGLIGWAVTGGKGKTSGEKAKPLDNQPSA
jgi:hypothetical protein